MFEWSYSGVDFSLDGNGGEECTKYLSNTQKIVETVVLVVISLFEICYPLKRYVVNYKPNLELRERFGRKLLLAALCLIWGIEIGYKLSSRQLIFILNPCHVATMIQVGRECLIFTRNTIFFSSIFKLVLLISPPRYWVHVLFRWSNYIASGATIAIIFPVLNTRHVYFK